MYMLCKDGISHVLQGYPIYMLCRDRISHVKALQRWVTLHVRALHGLDITEYVDNTIGTQSGRMDTFYPPPTCNGSPECIGHMTKRGWARRTNIHIDMAAGANWFVGKWRTCL